MAEKFEIIISGDSMYPFLQSGEKVKAQAVDPSTVAIGDIIVYQKFEDHLTAHRVIEIMNLSERRMCFITKGDNNPDKDDYIVHPHQIMGRVIKMNKAEWNTERKLILLLARVTFDEGVEKQIQEITANYELDWDYIMSVASTNKVCTLIFKNLFDLIPEINIPSDIKTNYRCLKLKLGVHNKYIFNQYDLVAETLKKCGVSCFPLKGSWLLPYLYKDLSLRSINDIDCLFDKNDESKLIAAMETIGYFQGQYDSIENKITKFSREKQIAWKSKMNNLLPFQKTTDIPSCPVVIFDFSFALDLSLDQAPIKAMIEESVNGLLKKPHFFIHLCCHLYKEAINAIWIMETTDLNIIKFCDIREYLLIMNPQEIEEAIEFSKKYGIEKAVYFSCYYLGVVYNEDYSFILNRYQFESVDFLYQFGEKDFNEKLTWKKDFMDRLFAVNNLDELESKQDFVKNYQTFLRF
jgi:signal peptidase I